jgi:hypothetical protein
MVTFADVYYGDNNAVEFRNSGRVSMADHSLGGLPCGDMIGFGPRGGGQIYDLVDRC